MLYNGLPDMEGILPFLRQKRVFVFACIALLFAMLAAFAPSLRHPFMSDDYHVLASLAGGPWDLRFFWTGDGKYMIPVTKLLWVLEYALFGTEAKGYHVVSLLLHGVNTVLVVLFFGRLLKSKWSGLLTGAFFALSASHWRTAMWMSAQMKLLAAFFLLLGLFAFFRFLKTGRKKFLVLTVLAQIGMPFSSALGMELPFVLALFFLFMKRQSGQRRATDRQVWQLLVGLLVLCLTYVLLQRILYAHANPYFLSAQGIGAALRNLLTAGGWVLVGLFEGFGHAMTGFFWGANLSIFGLHGAAFPLSIRLIPLGVLAILLLLPKRKGFWMLTLLFCAWTVLLYVPPVLPDIAQGFTLDWFVTRARYFYVPAIPAAALLTVLLTGVRLPRRRPLLRGALCVLLPLFAAFMLCANLGRIATLESYASDITEGFAVARDAYVHDLRQLLGRTWGTQVVTITDAPMGPVTGFEYAGHNVLPSHLAKTYLIPDECASFRFLPVGVPAEYTVSGKGTLWPPVRR